MQTIEVGSTVEGVVCAFLESQNLSCLQKNYRCRLGEVDLVMQDQTDQALVFVEVRFRSYAAFGTATETVHIAKQRKLKRAVLHYLQKHANATQSARIDVVGVSRFCATDEPPIARSYSGVTYHQYGRFLLRWTRNAVED